MSQNESRGSTRAAPLIAAAILGAAAGGAGVWIALGGGAGETRATTGMAAGSAEPSAGAAAPEALAGGAAAAIQVPADPGARQPAAQGAREDAAAASDVARAAPSLGEAELLARLSERAQPDPPREREPGEVFGRGKNQEMTEGARQFMNDRSRASTYAFIDAAKAALDSHGTPDQETLQKELFERFRNANYFAPDELKPSLRRLYEASKLDPAEDEGAALEWEQARRDLHGALDNASF